MDNPFVRVILIFFCLINLLGFLWALGTPHKLVSIYCFLIFSCELVLACLSKRFFLEMKIFFKVFAIVISILFIILTVVTSVNGGRIDFGIVFIRGFELFVIVSYVFAQAKLSIFNK